MRLKSLELYGFKSFADRTDFSFDAGITALVGPNGSGKSNVVDAVRWILGEQRAKSLRGKEMLDVIFGGAPTRQATGYAEAALTFSNEDGRLPVEFDEVKLARRLYRDGTSEYLINDNTTRLKDIRDLLMDTGVGTSAYSIMEQGRIDSILRANPADRRAIFEEAAGISKFKARRKETIKKLERVDQNLLRLADITEEVQRRLRSLKIQAGKARRFQEYDEALRELRSRVSRHDYYDLKQRIVESETVLQKLRSDREDGAALRDDLESAIQEVEGEMRELRLRIDATRAERSRREADHRAAEERIGMLQRRLEELQEETASMEERLVEIRTLCESQRSEEQGATTEAEQAEESLAQKQRARQELSERAAEIEEEVSGLEEQRGEWTRQLESARGEETRLRNRAIESASELSSLEERCEKLGEEVAQADALKAELVAENEAAREALEKTAQTIRERRELASELAEKLGERRAELTGLDGRLERAGSEIERLDGRREALAESLERLEGVAGGARALVEAAHGGAVELKGVVDVLSNLMEVDDDHVPPLEAALGDRLDGVVVRDDASADAALAYLQEHRLGIATILVADGATGR
ncbi:MAG: AAA family ATPase [Planctomycetota bacterium]